jgi:hypothetical protein
VDVHGGKAMIHLTVTDAKKATSYLSASGYRILESEIIVVHLEDKPGELSKMSSLLANEKIRILSLFFIAKDSGTSVLALKVDNVSKAKKLLAPYMNKEE